MFERAPKKELAPQMFKRAPKKELAPYMFEHARAMNFFVLFFGNRYQFNGAFKS